jgi:predicted membrane protein
MEIPMNTKKVTLIAMLASAYAVLSLLPGMPMIGAEGTTIDMVRMLEIGYGLVLGPVYGPAAAFIGAVVGKMLKGGGFGLFFTPLAAVSAFIAAMLGRGIKKGWMGAAGVLGVLTAGWYLFETGRTVPLYPMIQYVGLAIILVFRGKISEMIKSEDRKTVTLGVLLCSFPSTVTGHMLGGLIYIVLLNPAASIFVGILPIAIIERVAISIGATLFGTSLILAVRKIYPDLLE